MNHVLFRCLPALAQAVAPAPTESGATGETVRQVVHAPSLTHEYGPIFATVGFALIIALAVFSLATLLGPKNPTPEKLIPYESGSETTGARHVRLSVKFYLTAILFVVFDIEAVFLYPWASLFREFGFTGLIEMAAFLATLTVALIYVWRKGALEWET